MPRIAENRDAAEPTSPAQRERYARMLRAASRLGAQSELERVQMHDVAREAGVAIATVYRYFPSKVHLFATLMRSQVERLDALTTAPEPDADALETVTELMLRIARLMQQQPVLSLAMIQANNLAQTADTTDSEVIDRTFQGLVLRAAGLDESSEDGRRRTRLLMQCWFGALLSSLNGHSTAEVAEADIRLACQLLLHDLV